MTINASALTAKAFVETTEAAPRFWQIGLLWRLLATGHKTGGALCFVDEVNGVDEGGPVTHTHPQDEGLYLVDGTCTFFAGGETLSAGPGTFVAVPRHTEHAFLAAPGCRFLNFYLPAGFEMIVTGLGAPALRNEPPRPGECALPPRWLVDKLGADYGQTSVRGTPFADPPRREHMVTSPLQGARALPYAAHVSTARAWWNNGILWSVLADGASTDGSYTLFEELCPRGSGAPPHLHHHADDVFFVLDGEVEFLAGEVRQVAGPGAFVFVPRGTVHAFRVRSETARLLNLYTEPGFERLIEATGRPAATRSLPPPHLAPADLSATARQQLMAEIGMLPVAWPDPLA